jgi:asparagine synthase (glutamine-hydrolysing)
LEASAERLSHRGPDAKGIYSEPGVGLVHRRLSLLDLSERGNQPFWDEQRRYAIVYNGEVYNFKELRTRLEKDCVRFRSTTDTEVMLEYVKRFDLQEALLQFEGMFAFCIYDRVTKTFTLARDRFGIKPLFYYDEDDAFVFSSEVAGMQPWIALEADPWSIASYLFGHGGPTQGDTFYKHIKILPPGGVLKVAIGRKAEAGSFFSLPEFYDAEQAAQLSRSKPETVFDQLEERMLKSIELQLFADAPVGALCSGGIDSAVITAMAAKRHNNLAIFHADVVGRCSEYPAAKRLADYLKLDLKTVPVTDADCLIELPRVIGYFGHPFVTMPSSIPFYKVSGIVRSQGVKAVLTGEGADECFLGYPFLQPEEDHGRRLASRVKRMAVQIRNKVQRRGDFNGEPLRFVNGYSPYSCMKGYVSPQSAESALQLLNGFEVVQETEDLADACRRCSDFYGYAQSLDLLNYNLRALLHRNDCMGMANSIESRFPFLDSALVKLAVNIPYRLKMRHRFFPPIRGVGNLQNKWVLRSMAKRYLPRDIIERPKQGFPYDVFRRLKLRTVFFKDSALVDTLRLSEHQIKHIIDRFQQDLKIRLLQLEIWWEKCLLNIEEDSICRRLRDGVEIAEPAATDRWLDTG